MGKQMNSGNGTAKAWIDYPVDGDLTPKQWIKKLNARLAEKPSPLCHEYILETRRQTKGALLSYQSPVPYPRDCDAEPNAWVSDLNRALEEREKHVMRTPFTRRPFTYMWDKNLHAAVLTYRQNSPGGSTEPSTWMATPTLTEPSAADSFGRLADYEADDPKNEPDFKSIESAGDAGA